jgi:hypothetical protein
MTDCGKNKFSYLCAKYYSPPEHGTVGEIVVLLRGRVFFTQHMHIKHKWLGIKMHKMCDAEA